MIKGETAGVTVGGIDFDLGTPASLAACGTQVAQAANAVAPADKRR